MEYQLKRLRRSGSIKIRVEADGQVGVTAPAYVPKLLIERFVKTNETWVKRQQARVRLHREVQPVFDWEQKVVSYLGRLYKIRIMNQESRIMVKPKEITVSPVTGLGKDAKKMLVTWLKREGEREIRERSASWARLMQVTPGPLRFRQQKSRWGSCSHKNHLSFNWRLIHFKPAVIDYVVIHELAHIQHHDHSLKFWQLVEQFDPSYQQQRTFSRKRQLSLLKS